MEGENHNSGARWLGPAPCDVSPEARRHSLQQRSPAPPMATFGAILRRGLEDARYQEHERPIPLYSLPKPCAGPFRLRVLTLNVWGLPFVSGSLEERIDAICDHVCSSRFDLIGFQVRRRRSGPRWRRQPIRRGRVLGSPAPRPGSVPPARTGQTARCGLRCRPRVPARVPHGRRHTHLAAGASARLPGAVRAAHYPGEGRAAPALSAHDACPGRSPGARACAWCRGTRSCRPLSTAMS